MNTIECTELVLYTLNSGDIYDEVATHAIERAARQVVKGKAINKGTVFARLARVGANRYVQEHGSTGDKWHEMFNAKCRRQAALEFFDHYKSLIEHYAQEIIGPEILTVESYDYDHDMYGNPTAHYSVNAKRVTSRRVQAGYDSGHHLDGAYTAISNAGYMPGWYTCEGVENDRPSASSTWHRKPVVVQVSHQFEFKILARQKGAIGVEEKYTVARRAISEDAARAELYDEYDHVTVLGVRQVN